MEQAPPDEPLTIARIIGCARCGGSHEDVIARRMVRPFAPAEAFDPQRGQLTWTHWAPCPTNGDPILVMVEPDAVRSYEELGFPGGGAFTPTLGRTSWRRSTEVRRG